MPDSDSGCALGPLERSAPRFGARAADAGPDLYRPEPSDVRRYGGPASHGGAPDRTLGRKGGAGGGSFGCGRSGLVGDVLTLERAPGSTVVTWRRPSPFWPTVSG
jgi:hypothetical protein